ncbi:MAG: hypothetical protein N3A65_02185 [candidate division WOR-3 bacterium]|nr:hypothetical protein [candidate division WOR-3 bacterium]
MNIRSSAPEIRRALCTFCGYGCEFGIVFDDFGIKGVEYLKDTPNNGRLCPRGSASIFYLNHPKRLYIPVVKDKYTEWEFIKKDFLNILNEPDSIAVTIDKNLTIEEELSVIGFCNKYNIKNIASAYLEPEGMIGYLKDRNSLASPDEIDTCDFIIVLGDVFNFAPMISRNLINWKLSDRKHRLVVIDSIHNHTSHFATDFLKVKPGSEGIFMLKLAGEPLSKVNVEEICGIPVAKIEAIAGDFNSARNGLFIVTMAFAHIDEPQLVFEGIRKLSEETKKRILPVFEFLHHHRLKPFATVLELIRNNKLKYLINFGELFPFYYPQLLREISNLNIYSTSTIRFKDCVQLPFALNMEKSGSVMTMWGVKKLYGEIQPPSGAKTISEIFKILEVEIADTKSDEWKLKIDLKEGIQRIRERVKKRGLTLFGEKISFYYLGLLEKPVLKMNPLDAYEMGLNENGLATIESRMGVARLPVKITNAVPQGAIFTQPETPEVRRLFEYEIVDDLVNFIPTEVKVWQEE